MSTVSVFNLHRIVSNIGAEKGVEAAFLFIPILFLRA
jgi:hypothetical protein|tara:strand:- start:399 stop:509 length:111 start_codon:yes stop_codon:yes gene_type:complete